MKGPLIEQLENRLFRCVGDSAFEDFSDHVGGGFVEAGQNGKDELSLSLYRRVFPLRSPRSQKQRYGTSFSDCPVATKAWDAA